LVVIVEGASDRVAVEALAERLRLNLRAEGIRVVAAGGAGNLGKYLEKFGPHGQGVRLGGLCDAAEEGYFRRGLERAGLGRNLNRDDMERLGFYVCIEDLEDELIRSLGAASVQAIIERQGELGSFRTFQGQPAQRGRAVERQLWRFMGTRAGRKARYARLLVEALDLARVPAPLGGLLSHMADGPGPGS
jgi:Overcoming lysogenization defect protein-like, TOPRIM domain